MTDFEEYIRQGEPEKREKSYAWQTAIGLQQVDGLKPSAYLIETAKQQVVEHIAHFVAYLWQIHIFGEGNTRTTAVFLIKYLRKLGFKNATNDLFAEHSWYFRNALVRANYENLSSDVHRTNEYRIRFLSNLLLGEIMYWKTENCISIMSIL